MVIGESPYDREGFVPDSSLEGLSDLTADRSRLFDIRQPAERKTTTCGLVTCLAEPFLELPRNQSHLE